MEQRGKGEEGSDDEGGRGKYGSARDVMCVLRLLAIKPHAVYLFQQLFPISIREFFFFFCFVVFIAVSGLLLLQSKKYLPYGLRGI